MNRTQLVVAVALVLVALTAPARAQQQASRLTPQQAADILRDAPYLSNWTNRPAPAPPDGPSFFVFGGRPDDGPWSWPAGSARRRAFLDIAPLSREPYFYATPWWIAGPSFTRPYGSRSLTGPASSTAPRGSAPHRSIRP